jgi:hypothetical protein
MLKAAKHIVMSVFVCFVWEMLKAAKHTMIECFVCFVCEMLKAVKPFSDCGLRKLVLTVLVMRKNLSRFAPIAIMNEKGYE